MNKKYIISLKTEHKSDIFEVADKITQFGGVVHNLMKTVGIICASMNNVTFDKVSSLEKIKNIREEQVLFIS